MTTYWREKSNLDDGIKGVLVDCLTQRQEQEGKTTQQQEQDCKATQQDQEGKTMERQGQKGKSAQAEIFNKNIAHAYAEWQSCLLAAYDLNILLGKPLPDFKACDVLQNGSQIYQAYHCMKQQQERKRIVEKFHLEEKELIEKYYLHFWYGIPVRLFL